MFRRSERHQALVEELVEWWEDLSRSGIGSRAILFPAARGWGRTTVLRQFAAVIRKDHAISILVTIHGTALPDGIGLQAQILRDLLTEAELRRKAAEFLGVDRLNGVVQLGLGVGGLFVSPVAAAVAVLVAGVGIGAAGRVWDDTPAGKEGALARAARAVAAISASVPVVVLIDDADCLELRLAVTLIETLIERHNGQVLVVAASDPNSNLFSALTSRASYGLTAGRVLRVDADFDMGYEARVDLTAELCPGLPISAVRRIAQRTRTFGEAFAVTLADRLADVDTIDSETAVVTLVDEVINARIKRASPSPEAVILAWCGGILHARQADLALAALGAKTSCADGYIIRFESLIRLTDPASPDLTEQVKVLATDTQHRLAAAVLDAALDLGADAKVGLIERVVAWRAVHRVRAHLDNREPIVAMQCQLVQGLEALGDVTPAYEVAQIALAEHLDSHPDSRHSQERDQLMAAVLRLSQAHTALSDNPLVGKAVGMALTGGAAVGFEARLWAAIDLLRQSGQRDVAVMLMEDVTSELETLNDLGSLSSRWRLLLAFHAGRAGYPTIAQRLLTPMLNPDSPEQWDAAQAVLYAVSGPRADTRLQIVVLEAELQASSDAHSEDLLRLHTALGSAYATLGNYHQALDHGLRELSLRHREQGANHPATLTTRHNIAAWTGQCGDAAQALRLFTELLPNQVRLLGPDHADTLHTRNDIAHWTGEYGDAAQALRLCEELLPDQVVALGPAHQGTLVTRSQIARWTGECGDAAQALRLFTELLPNRVRLLGPDHADTLHTRNDIAHWTGECGDAAQALRLFTELLPDEVRVFAPDHPSALATRSRIACWTGECGDAAQALRLFTGLLPDQVLVLGPDYRGTLLTRSHIAHWTGEFGDAAQALRLSEELLPDQVRVLGPEHPNTLATRSHIARWTGECGDAAQALRLFTGLLPDQVRVLGPDHTRTVATRGHIARWTGACGDAAQALRLSKELLPDEVRVLGPDHSDTLTTRHNIAILADECGDAAQALRLSKELLPDQARVLGPDHTSTLATRRHIVTLTALCEGGVQALRLSEELLPDQMRVLGSDHADTLATRKNIAILTAVCGDAAQALRLFTDLLPDRVRVLGPDDPDTLATRNSIANFTGASGDAAQALRLFTGLLPDQVRVLGPDDPNTLATRGHIAHWTGACGDVAQALRLSKELLPDQVRVLGPDHPDTWATQVRVLGTDHPDTLTTRNNIAILTAERGDVAQALRLSKELLPDQTGVLGLDHPDTLATRNNIAVLTAACGDPVQALRLSEKLLPDRVRILGTDHPDTLATRNNIAILASHVKSAEGSSVTGA